MEQFNKLNAARKIPVITENKKAPEDKAKAVITSAAAKEYASKPIITEPSTAEGPHKIPANCENVKGSAKINTSILSYSYFRYKPRKVSSPDDAKKIPNANGGKKGLVGEVKAVKAFGKSFIVKMRVLPMEALPVGAQLIRVKPLRVRPVRVVCGAHPVVVDSITII